MIERRKILTALRLVLGSVGLGLNDHDAVFSDALVIEF